MSKTLILVLTALNFNKTHGLLLTANWNTDKLLWCLLSCKVVCQVASSMGQMDYGPIYKCT
jgi:hypothetical protein